MARPEAAVADLVPLADRVRWMLTYRMAVVVLVPIAAATGVLPGPPFGRLFLVGAGWLALTLLSLPAQRLGRGVAISVFTASLLGDGLLLGALRPSLGWLGGPIEIVVVGHVVAVTLLASFRTGIKITIWHLLVCFLVLESRAAGLLGPPVDVQLNRFVVVMSLLWLIMAATASFAAVNERELRRRRYDTERLHAFGSAVAHSMEPVGVVGLLAAFARDELLARRAAVLLLPRTSAAGLAGIGYALDPDGAREQAVFGSLQRRSVVRKAMDTGQTVLAARLNGEDDPVLAGLLPGARSLIVVPLPAGEVGGALVIEHARWSSQRASRRVELRMIGTAEQAAAQAALAVGRALLLDQARKSAQTDGLTGLANRRAFDERLAVETGRATSGGGLVTLVMIDLDHFKRLNDTYGHQVGDETLQTAARVLQENSPVGSLAARYGGEELALILPDTDVAAGVAIAEQIRAALAAAAGAAPVTASLGLASCPAFGTTPAELLAAADAALYEAKHSGRNRVVTARRHAHAAA